MKDLTHEQAQSFLQAPTQLMAAERTSLSAHLAYCPACTIYAEEVKTIQTATAAMLRRRWDGHSVDPDITRNILIRLKRNKLQKQLFTIAGATAAIAVVLIIFLLIQSPLKQNPLQPGAPTAANTPVTKPTEVQDQSTLTIGILAGYELQKETGETCPDGTTEAAITLNIANLVKSQLEGEGYSVEVLDTIDNRMNGDKKDILLILQTNDCEAASGSTIIGLELSGEFKGTASKSGYLTSCLSENYIQTGIRYLQVGGVTRSLGYIFNRYDSESAVAQVTLGSLGADQQILVEQPEVAAQSLGDGLRCFLKKPWESFSIEKSYSQILRDPTNPSWHGYLGLLYLDLLDYERALIELGCAVDGCDTYNDTVAEAAGAPNLQVVGLPLSEGSLEFYYTYSSVLAALASEHVDYCLQVRELNEQLKAFAPNDSKVASTVLENNYICAQVMSAPKPTTYP